jgi:carboxyl-terminal processing protease
MNSKVLMVILSVLVALVLVTTACSAGFLVGRVFDPGAIPGLANVPLISGEKNPLLPTGSSGSTTSREKLFAAFWQTWDLVHEQYVDQPVNDQVLMRGAIKGMLDALGDKHTSYMDPDQYIQANQQLNGESYEGIGAWVDVKGEYLSIISPMPGSPAEKAGLRPGDVVIGVDGEDMTGIDGELVRQKIIGPNGTTVVLTIRRKSVEQPFDVTVQRAKITVPTVEKKTLEGNIAYVRLYTFGDKTAEDLRAALKDLLAEKPAGLILDLRYNGGGYLETAIDVSSEFISDGVIMYEEYGDGKRRTFEAKGGGLATDIPMVVLVNEGSASASEIVAGAIQDRGRGKLVGVTTYGKGSVQIFTPLMDNQGAVRITIARWLTPNGQTINQKGLTPDVEVVITDNDANNNRDTQLEKAVELLKNQK